MQNLQSKAVVPCSWSASGVGVSICIIFRKVQYYPIRQGVFEYLGDPLGSAHTLCLLSVLCTSKFV